MRDSRAACLICRGLAVKPGPLVRRTPQWLATAPFSSATTSSSSPSPHPTTSPRPARPRSSRRAQAKGRDSLAIFESVVNAQRKENAPSNPPTVQPPLGFETYQNLADLKDMLADPATPITSSYNLFRERIYQDLVDARYVPEIFRWDILRLLGEVYEARGRDWNSTELPSLSELTLVAIQLDVVRRSGGAPWRHLVQSLVLHLSKVVSPEAHDSIQSFEASGIANKTRLVQELIEAWRLVSLPRALVAKLGGFGKTTDLEGEFRLPSFEHWNPLGITNARGLWGRLDDGMKLLLPELPDPLLRRYAGTLLVSFVVLNDDAVTTSEVRASAAPLLAPVSRVLTSVNLSAMVKSMDVLPELVPYLGENWQTVRERVMGLTGATYSKKQLDMTGVKTRSDAEIAKEISHALHNNSTRRLELAWVGFVGEEKPPSDLLLKRLRGAAGIFREFISAFAALRLPNRSADVMEYMSSIGIRPSAKEYTAMLHGFKLVRSVSGLRSTWDRVIASGVKPDVPLWAALVSGLIECGRPDGALRALHQMDQIWTENPKSPMAVKPTVAVVNAALAGVLRINGQGTAKKLLEWAARRDISPDLSTYNILLRTLVRECSPDVDVVLAMMEADRIEPDATTLTILVDGMGPYIQSLAAADQVATVKRLLGILPNPALRRNHLTYAKLVHVIVQNGGSDDAVSAMVNTVLSRLQGLGAGLTAPVLSILVEHYLSRSTPKVDAVLALLENHRMFDENARVADAIFWERVISGLLNARRGEPEVAFGVFARLPHSSSVVPLKVLDQLLDALWQTGRRDAAARLVEMVRADRAHAAAVEGVADTPGSEGGEGGDGGGDDGGVLDGPQKRDLRFWSHRFWDTAANYGLHSDDMRKPAR